jgi:gliding motility-associated-like protein
MMVNLHLRRFFGIFVLLILAIQCRSQTSGLYINEVSQGPSGSKEYVELLVVGTPTCYSIPTLDLRGWYIDDNNGFHATGTGTGIAAGCVRFSQDPLWSAVPIGTLIVIYNDADINSTVPANDLSLSDGNCRLVIPVSNCALLEKHTTTPSTASAVYPATGLSACGNWGNISMANSDDSFQTVTPAGTVFHSVSWGNNTLNTIIYFAGTSAGTVALMNNTTNNNINTQANWSRVTTVGNESPGVPNNVANQLWICSMNNGCTPLLPISLTSTQTNASCSCTGSASVTASGGFNGCGNPYTYSWSSSAGNTPSVSGLCSGGYTVVVSDVNGCTSTQTFNITSSSALSLSGTQTNVNCNGSATGSASIAVTGGTGPFTYNWLPSGGTGSSATGLVAGIYTVVVTDASSCTDSYTFNITQPAPISLSSTQTNVLCNGGSTGAASVTATGGTGSYTYAWSPSGGTNANATGLAAGTYTVTVSSPVGCTSTQTYSITQPPILTSTATQTNVSCNGGSSGAASVTVSGGNGPYTYSWTPAVGTGSNVTSLTSGGYTVIITDANSCTTTRTFNITQPTSISATSTFTPATCGNANGSASVAPSGGSGPYTYVWSPSGGTGSTATGLISNIYTVTVTDANGCTTSEIVNVPNTGSQTTTITASANVSCFGGNNGSATVTATGGTGPLTYSWSPTGGSASTATALTAGNYTATVTDANGCTSSTTVVITEPPALTLTTSSNAVHCFGGNTGSATVNATGGAPGYTFSWSPSGGTGSTTSGLTTGNYTVTVVDANGCTNTSSVNVTQPAALATSTSSSDVLCYGGNSGSASVVVSGGTSGYTYNWSPSGGTGSTATGLIAGTYTITTTDANGCTITASVTVAEPSPLVISISSTQSTCGNANGTATAAPSGGTPGYTYLWSPAGGTGSSASGLVAGTYSCVITDMNGCTNTASVSILNSAGPTATIAPPVMVTCFGGSNGVATVSANGGTGPYTYSWSNADTDTIAGNLTAGSYTVTVSDVTGCTSTATALITEPASLNIQANTNPTAICVGASVQVSANAGGGTPIYSYNWQPIGLTGATQIITPSTTQIYTVTVTDANGCTASSTTGVIVNAAPTAAFSADVTAGCAPLCVNFLDSSTVINGSITGWLWDFGDNTSSTLQIPPVHCYNTPGVYTVILTVTTASGCAQSITVANYISVYATPVAAFGATPLPTTILSPTINFTDNSQNASSWLWSFGDINNSSSSMQNPSFTYQEADCYSVILQVTSSNGCQDTAALPVCIETDVTIYVPNTFTPDGDGLNDQFMPYGEGIDWSTLHMQIFDRWGNLLFETYDINKPWDGRVQGHSEIVQIDTYVWKIDVLDMKQVKHNLIGHVNVVR